MAGSDSLVIPIAGMKILRALPDELAVGIAQQAQKADFESIIYYLGHGLNFDPEYPAYPALHEVAGMVAYLRVCCWFDKARQEMLFNTFSSEIRADIGRKFPDRGPAVQGVALGMFYKFGAYSQLPIDQTACFDFLVGVADQLRYKVYCAQSEGGEFAKLLRQSLEALFPDKENRKKEAMSLLGKLAPKIKQREWTIGSHLIGALAQVVINTMTDAEKVALVVKYGATEAPGI